MMLFERVKAAGEALRTSGREAIAQAHAAGMATYYSDEAGIIREQPNGIREQVVLDDDGRKRVVERLPPRPHQLSGCFGSDSAA
jgi:hypothetical protein